MCVCKLLGDGNLFHSSRKQAHIPTGILDFFLSYFSIHSRQFQVPRVFFLTHTEILVSQIHIILYILKPFISFSFPTEEIAEPLGTGLDFPCSHPKWPFPCCLPPNLFLSCVTGISYTWPALSHWGFGSFLFLNVECLFPYSPLSAYSYYVLPKSLFALPMQTELFLCGASVDLPGTSG